MVVCFEVSAPFAFFKKPFTKTSSDVYIVPPKTAIIGLIAAIRGWKRDSYDDYIRNTLVGIILEKIPYKIPFNFNFENTKDTKSPRIQFGAQVLRDVRYKIFINDDSLYEVLKDLKPVYTPYLGSSNMLASIENVSLIDLSLSSLSSYTSISVVPKNSNEARIYPERGDLLFQERIPYCYEYLEGNRMARFKDFVYSSAPLKVENNPSKVLQFEKGVVVMF